MKTFDNIPVYDRMLAFLFYFYLIVFAVITRNSFDIKLFFAVSVGSYRVAFVWFAFVILFAAIFYTVGAVNSLMKSSDMKKTAKNLADDCMSLSRTVILILTAFAAYIAVLAAITQKVKGNLMTHRILGWEKSLFGCLPSEWIHTSQNPLKTVFDLFTPGIIFSYNSLSLFICAAFVFLLYRNRTLFTCYIISFYIGATLCLPIWYTFPVNSPNHSYIAGKLTDQSEYKPNTSVTAYQMKMYEDQKHLPPISCFPSSHVIWAVITMYYLYLYDRRIIYFCVIWFPLMILGTVYLAQHYAVDILPAVPVAVISIFLTGKLVHHSALERMISCTDT